MMTMTAQERSIARAATQPNPASALVTLISQAQWPPQEDIAGNIVAKLKGGLWLTQLVNSFSLREIQERLALLETTYGMLADIEPDPDRSEALRMAQSEAHALGILVGAGTLASRASRRAS